MIASPDTRLMRPDLSFIRSIKALDDKNKIINVSHKID